MKIIFLLISIYSFIFAESYEEYYTLKIVSNDPYSEETRAIKRSFRVFSSAFNKYFIIPHECSLNGKIESHKAIKDYITSNIQILYVNDTDLKYVLFGINEKDLAIFYEELFNSIKYSYCKDI